MYFYDQWLTLNVGKTPYFRNFAWYIRYWKDDINLPDQMHISQNSGISSQLFLSVGKQQSKNIQFFVLSLGILADRTGDAEGSEGPAKDTLSKTHGDFQLPFEVMQQQLK